MCIGIAEIAAEQDARTVEQRTPAIDAGVEGVEQFSEGHENGLLDEAELVDLALLLAVMRQAVLIVGCSGHLQYRGVVLHHQADHPRGIGSENQWDQVEEETNTPDEIARTGDVGGLL